MPNVESYIIESDGSATITLEGGERVIVPADMPPSKRITVYDPNGVEILVGSKVTCGTGEPGVVVEITEPEETHGRVMVKWPEFDDPEGFIYHGTGWCWEGPDVCDEVEVYRDKDGGMGTEAMR